MNISAILKESAEDAVRQFRSFDETNRRNVYLEILRGLKTAIKTNKTDNFQRLFRLLSLLGDTSELSELLSSFSPEDDFFKMFNAIITACKFNREKFLDYILSEICITSGDRFHRIYGALPSPNDTDEESHNVFYYAVRSGNTKLLEILMTKWPKGYFSSNPVQLYCLLAQNYHELQLKNVDISMGMQIFIQSTLLDLYFENKLYDGPMMHSHEDINERISFISECYNRIKESSIRSGSESETIFLAKHICLNVFILKKLLKSTYDRIPWEEMEYHLVSYIRYLSHQGDYSSSFVIGTDIVAYLGYFLNCLVSETNQVSNMSLKDIGKIRHRKRDDIVNSITKKYPSFKDFYHNYEIIRDRESLSIIKKYIDIASEVNPHEKSGQTKIIRSLQVIGENLKNTLESPKLSSITSNYLMSFLPAEANKVLITLRNSFSHGFSLSKCKEIEEIYGSEFYASVQKDLINLNHGITSVLHENKFKSIRILLEKICNCENIDRLKDIFQMLRNLNIQDCLSGKFPLNTDITELKKLISDFSEIIKVKTHVEESLFLKVGELINANRHILENAQIMYQKFIATLGPIHFSDSEMDDYAITVMKKLTRRALVYLTSQRKSENLKDVGIVMIEIIKNVQHRVEKYDTFKLCCIIQKILHVTENRDQDTQYLNQLRDSCLKANSKEIQNQVESKEMTSLQDFLHDDMAALKKLVDEHNLAETQIDTFNMYRSDVSLQAEVEMLVLSILSCLKNSKSYLVTNQLYLNAEYPLLVSTELRNHLAHGNALVDILMDSVQSLFLFAVKLTKNDIYKKRKKSWVKDSKAKFDLQSYFDRSISYLKTQTNLFSSLSNGSLKDTAHWIKEGADLNGRDNNLMTTLHYAAQSSNLKTFQYLANYEINPEVKDFNNRSVLHIAAAFGNKNIVDFIIKNFGLSIDVVCDKNNTPLHLAAENGRFEVVEALLQRKAKTCVKNMLHMTPLDLAVIHSRVKIVKLFLQDVKNINSIKSVDDFSLLHIASEKGYLELVIYFLDKGADVNSVTCLRQSTPLHLSAFFGHLEIVETLLRNGANLNARNVENQTALHKAVESGHLKIVDLLLDKGSDAIGVDLNGFSALHFAIRERHIDVLKRLLEHDPKNKFITLDVSVLEYAALTGDLDIVNCLIENDAPIRKRRDDGFSILHFCVRRGSTVILKRLIEYGVDVNVKDRHGQTPLYLAIKLGNLKAVELLIISGADVFSTYESGQTLLHVCASVSANLRATAWKSCRETADKTLMKNNEIDGDCKATSISDTDQLKIFISLTDNGADIEKTNDYNQTPLHVACGVGNIEIVRYLVEVSANIHISDKLGYTPLHYAVEGNSFECVQIILENSRNSLNSVTSSGDTSLCLASKLNYTKVARLLIRFGADLNAGDPLYKALEYSSQDVSEILLQRKGTKVWKQFKEKHVTFLQLAAMKGLIRVISVFLANKALSKTASPEDLEKSLEIAISDGNDNVVTLLIDYGVDANKACLSPSSPLHFAVAQGYYRTVEVLMKKGVDMNISDADNRRPIEFAASNNRLKIMKILYENHNISLNDPGNGDFTLLHIAAQYGHLGIVKFLIKEGAATNLPNSSGSKPIHIAVREGHLHILQYFFNHDEKSLKERGCSDKTLLHYAAQAGRTDIAKYLIEKGMDVNDSDENGVSPAHVASLFGFEDILRILLNNGAIYNCTDKTNNTPFSIANDQNIKSLLLMIKSLFHSVKSNNISSVKSLIEKGVCVNAKDSTNSSPLHYAAWKGFSEVTMTLLMCKGNPKSFCGKGYTPLHYACKFNCFEVVKSLLESGAMYKILSKTQKVPLEFAEDRNISNLLKLIDRSFSSIQDGSCEVIKNLKEALSSQVIKSVVNAKNEEGKTLITWAITCNFLEIDKLKRIICEENETYNYISDTYNAREQLDKSLNFQTKLLRKKEKLLGSKNPYTLETEEKRATILYKMEKYHQALNICKEILRKKETIFGVQHKETLKTQGFIGLILHRLDRNTEAIEIFDHIYPQLSERFGLNDIDVLQTLSEMALVLNALRRHEEALNADKTVHERFLKLYGANDYRTLTAQNNIGRTLIFLQKYEEAIPILRSVYKARARILGRSHSDTCRTLDNLNAALGFATKSDEALEGLQEALNRQKNSLGWKHIETLNTERRLGILLDEQGKNLEALKILQENIRKRKIVLGENHPSVVSITQVVDRLNTTLSIASPESLSHLNKNDRHT